MGSSVIYQEEMSVSVCVCICMCLGLEYICVCILVRRTELEGIEETKEISKRKKVMATKLFIDIY